MSPSRLLFPSLHPPRYACPSPSAAGCGLHWPSRSPYSHAQSGGQERNGLRTSTEGVLGWAVRPEITVTFMTILIVATDGSDLAIRAGAAGLSLTQPAEKVLIVSVADVVDPSLAEDATGHASSSMTHEDVEANHREARSQSRAAIEATMEALRNVESARDRVEVLVIDGEPGPALCHLAAEVGASALIVGSRGRGGLKRALLGSVSDYIVRNAPCSVIVSRDT
jgi:nucleotide-binding universal stress UspA family protein